MSIAGLRLCNIDLKVTGSCAPSCPFRSAEVTPPKKTLYKESSQIPREVVPKTIFCWLNSFPLLRTHRPAFRPIDRSQMVNAEPLGWSKSPTGRPRIASRRPIRTPRRGAQEPVSRGDPWGLRGLENGSAQRNGPVPVFRCNTCTSWVGLAEAGGGRGGR